MLDIIWAARMIFSILNIAILSFLIFVFSKRYFQLKSEFTLGFLLFALALFFRTLFASPLVRFFILGEESHSIIDPYRLIADVFELSALMIFLYISTK